MIGRRFAKHSERSPTTLYALRVMFEIKQSELGKEAGISQSLISDYENGLAMPERQAERLFNALKHLAGWEQRRMLAHLTPSDLPRPWVSVIDNVSAEMTHDDHGNQNVTVVA